MYFNTEIIKAKMNDAGGKKNPFLFGVDFEMKEGFFIADPLSQRDILFYVNGIGNFDGIDFLQSINYNDYQFEIFPEELTEYKKRFNRVMSGLKRGGKLSCKPDNRNTTENISKLKRNIFS